MVIVIAILLGTIGYTTSAISDNDNDPTTKIMNSIHDLQGKINGLGKDCAIRAPYVNLSGCNFSGSNLSNTYLPGADFTGANLTGANLSGAFLGMARFSNANLASADFSHANLSASDLSGANVSGTNFNGANLVAIKYASCTGLPVGTPASGSLPICG